MRWSVRIARIAGIEVRVHATFALLLLWVAYVERAASGTMRAALIGVIFILFVFATVVLHELGHALVAQRYGVQTKEITLLPIGGVSRLERMPEDPRQELWIAAAGPMVSVAVAGLLFLALLAAGAWPAPAGPWWGGVWRFVQRLMWVNVALAAFNLLPAFPMDGGRVVRSLLARKMPYPQATEWAARLGQGFALAFGILGVFYSPILILIALFIWLGASSEGAEAQVRAGLSGIPVKDAMVTDFRSVSPEEPLSRGVELVLAGAQEDFPVLDDGKLVGVLTRRGMLVALSRGGAEQPIYGAMDRDFQTADPSEMLSDALPRLRERECQTVPVERDGVVVGLLTRENISDFLAIRAARAAAPEPRAHA
ncbi:MAG: site-2 protease family protein [Polyangiaceae bacterium]